MKKIEKEIEFLRYQQESLKYGFDKYVNNYHHSMIWIVTIALGIVVILISLRKYEQIWIPVVFYLIATTWRLRKLMDVNQEVRNKLTNFDESINKRYFNLGLNLEKLKKEVKVVDGGSK